jgi:hypothetical protein
MAAISGVAVGESDFLRELGGTVRRNGRFDKSIVRMLGIGLLIAGFVRVPLPQADYHNIRHHDAPGEICVYHDHLLRWHPSADSDDDVALLHWHWFVPDLEFAGDGRVSTDQRHSPVSGPTLHAHLANLPESEWRGEPLISPESRGRVLEILKLSPSADDSAHLAFDPPSPPLQTNLFSSPFLVADGMRAARIALFERWNC